MAINALLLSLIAVSVTALTPRSNCQSTATKEVSIIDDNFYMPQLNRTRRIWVYTPPNYNITETEYPVIYMHDGQNLFDVCTSFAGEWKVDESLNTIFEEEQEGVIVVGIDNGEGERTDEYLPFKNSQYGGGQGDLYLDFIKDTLKPYIDKNYRTKPDQKNTGIWGSSLGGLISFYGAMRDQDVYSHAGCFSTSFWINDPEIFDWVNNRTKTTQQNYYFLVGGQEGHEQLTGAEEMYKLMSNIGFSVKTDLLLNYKEDGAHSEWFWAREFPDAFKWLFDGTMPPN